MKLWGLSVRQLLPATILIPDENAEEIFGTRGRQLTDRGQLEVYICFYNPNLIPTDYFAFSRVVCRHH